MLADYETLVDALVRDVADDVTDAERDDAIQLAVAQLGSDRPRTLVEDVTADGSSTLALPAGWEADFSDLVSVEYPVDENPPAEWNQENWRLYQAPAGWEIRLSDSVTAGESVRLGYTASHTLSAILDTIPAKYREGVSAYAAALILQELAARFAGVSEPTIGADAVDHRSKSNEYERRAKALLERYERIVGVKLNRTRAAGAVVNLQAGDSRGNDRLVHRRRYR